MDSKSGGLNTETPKQKLEKLKKKNKNYREWVGILFDRVSTHFCVWMSRVEVSNKVFVAVVVVLVVVVIVVDGERETSLNEIFF